MKRILILCGLVAAFMGLAQSANAQYLPAQIHRDGTGFVDEHGRTLSDRELIEAIGVDIYEETVVGARKQYSAGRSLLTAGIITSGVGAAGVLAGVAMMFTAGEIEFENHSHTAEDLGFAGAYVTYFSLAALGVGSTLLSAGIPLKIIGQSRLNWVENDYNDRQTVYVLRVGATPSGVGIALEF